MAQLFSLFNFGYSSASSLQEANINVSQTYNGSCDATATDTIAGDKFRTSGGFNVTMDASANGQCWMGASLESVNDVLQKAQNTAAAGTAGPAAAIFSGAAADVSETSSKNIINVSVQNSANQHCSTSSIAQFVDTTVHAGSSITIDMSTSTVGSCQLQALLSATNSLQQFSVNSSTAGKAKGAGGLVGTIIAVFVGIAVLAALAAAYKHFQDSNRATSLPGVSNVSAAGTVLSSLPK